MRRSTIVRAAAWVLGAAWASPGDADQAPNGLEVDATSIGGVVLNQGRPEPGVWVIAETGQLPTHFRRIVVTDDAGRFLVPDLPEAEYELWVRGYGLRDSNPVRSGRGATLRLEAHDALHAQEAARIYPANYWLSLYRPPPAEEIPETFEGIDHWVAQMKLGCMLCHQLGVESTRRIASPAAWDASLALAGVMPGMAAGLGFDAFRGTFSDWGARIAAGETPETPPRPQGIERNLVITQWNWGRNDSYIHDEISTDKRDPTLYPYGRVWGIDIGQDILWALDPSTHEVQRYDVPTRDDDIRPWGFASWRAYNWVANPHNPMMDDTGKVWITTQVREQRPEDYPDWAEEVMVPVMGTDRAALEAVAEQFARNHHRQLGYFDIEAEEFVLIDTAFSTHHLQFDWQGRIWSAWSGTSLGMFDPSRFDPERPLETEREAQRMYVQVDPETGRAVSTGGYGIIVNPVDGSVWRALAGAAGDGNRISRFDPETETYTEYRLPPPGRGPRGIDASTDGLIWFATGSGHLGRFDPMAEEFTFWETPGPKLRDTGPETGTADFHYYIWVDQFDTLGLGENTVIATGTNSDSLLAFEPESETFTVIRIPYPLSLFTRGLDGRIDDADAGWKGRGLWANYGNDPIRMVETRRGYINHIQLRPHPLAN